VGRTFADGVRTQSLGELGYEHVSRLVDDMVAVSEQEIESALVALLESRLIVEPAGALSLAAIQTGKVAAPGAVAVISGGNASTDLLGSLVERVARAQASGAKGIVTDQHQRRRLTK
jgi:threonine dehydratase